MSDGKLWTRGCQSLSSGLSAGNDTPTVPDTRQRSATAEARWRAARAATAASVNKYRDAVSRWEPNARERLERAALELYGERGFEQTTVAEIAQLAGLTERTFFRHFADKREVLFRGAAELQDLLASGVAAAPGQAPPLGAVMFALEQAAASRFNGRRELARQRHMIISADASLQERELIKLASLSETLAEGLRRRGVPAPAAGLAAGAGVLLFQTAYARWIAGGTGMDVLLHEALLELGALSAAPRRALAHSAP